jgi:hypothetical protein
MRTLESTNLKQVFNLEMNYASIAREPLKEPENDDHHYGTGEAG